jgi:cell wall-associated NlpC family hydrolase
MKCVKISITHDDEALYKHHRSSLLNERRTPSHPLHMQPGDTVTWNNQQASGIDHAPAMLAPLPNTPPPGRYIRI